MAYRMVDFIVLFSDRITDGLVAAWSLIDVYNLIHTTDVWCEGISADQPTLKDKREAGHFSAI